MIQDENMENSPRDHLKPGGATGQKQSFRYHPNSSFSKMLDLQHQPKLRHSYLGAAGISGFYSHGVSPSHSQSSLRPEEERHNETVLPKSKFGIQLIGVDPKDNEPDSEMRAAIQDQLNSSSEEQDGEDGSFRVLNKSESVISKQKTIKQLMIPLDDEERSFGGVEKRKVQKHEFFDSFQALEPDQQEKLVKLMVKLSKKSDHLFENSVFQRQYAGFNSREQSPRAHL